MTDLIEYRIKGPSDAKALRDIYQLITQTRARIEGEVPIKTMSLPERTEMLERNLIEMAMHESNRNISKAAEMLEISRVGLYGKLKRYGMKAEE